MNKKIGKVLLEVACIALPFVVDILDDKKNEQTIREIVQDELAKGVDNNEIK